MLAGLASVLLSPSLTLSVSLLPDMAILEKTARDAKRRLLIMAAPKHAHVKMVAHATLSGPLLLAYYSSYL